MTEQPVVGRPTAEVVNDLESWLAEQTNAVPDSIFWAPRRDSTIEDWFPVHSPEHLAVRISTAVRPDNNVCLVSGVRGFSGRTANVIGLVTRPHLAWAVVIKDSNLVHDVQSIGYPHDNYQGFGALAAADIAWSWVRSGGLPAGLEHKDR